MEDRRQSRKGLAATAIRLFAVVGLFLGPELALNSSLRHRTVQSSRSGLGSNFEENFYVESAAMALLATKRGHSAETTHGGEL